MYCYSYGHVCVCSLAEDQRSEEKNRIVSESSNRLNRKHLCVCVRIRAPHVCVSVRARGWRELCHSNSPRGDQGQQSTTCTYLYAFMCACVY